MKALIMGYYTEEFIEFCAKELDEIYVIGGKTLEYKKYLKSVDIVIIRSPFSLSKGDIVEAKNLKYIIRAGRGTENINSYYIDKNIKLYTTEGNASAVAEQVLGYIIYVYRFLEQCNSSVRNGEWKKNKFIGREINDKVIGILGFGYIGQEVGNLLYKFNNRILVFDRSIEKKIKKMSNMTLEKINSIEDIFKRSDIIINCLPLTHDTTYLIDFSLLNLLKKDALIINVGRGKVIKELDLYNYLKKNSRVYAAIDVYEEEPPKNSKLLELDNIIFTPHTGAQTIEARKKIETSCKYILKDIVKGEMK